LLLPALALYAIATAHLTVDAYAIVKAFITYRDAPGGPMAYFGDFSKVVNLLRPLFYALETLLGDFCLIYRCSLVWQHNIWIITLPILLWICCAVTGIGTIISYTKVSSEGQVFSIGGWNAIFFATTLATNVICTSMIAFRIWSVDRAVGKYRETKSTLKPVLAIVIESGAIYSASLMILLINYFSHNWVYFLLPQLITPIIGIVFSMIFVRMGLSLAWQNGSQNSSFLTTLRCNRPPATLDQPQSHFMQPVRVNITTSVDESQSEGIILVRSQSNYKNDSLAGDSVYDT